MYFRKTAVVLSLIVILFLVAGIQASRNYNYIGSKGCSRCHGLEEMGNQYAIWQGSPHARAYTLLSSDRALKIAEKTGITTPSENIECLRCHTTGGGRDESLITEGVSCESCHGPGSVYQNAGIHVDYADRKRGYARALKNGMYPILGDPHLKNREKLCLSCHNSKRPCIPETSQELLLKKMSIQTVDRLIRGDVNLRHPLRR